MSNLKKPEPPTPGAQKRPAKPPPVPQRPKAPPLPEPPMELSDDELISIPPPPPSMRSEGEVADFDARPETVSVTEVELVDPHPPAQAPLPFLHLGPDVATLDQTWFTPKRIQWFAAAAAAFVVGVGGGYRFWSRSPAIAAAPAAPLADLRAFDAPTQPAAKQPEVAAAIHASAPEPAPAAAAFEGTSAANEKEAPADDLVRPASRVSVASSAVQAARPASTGAEDRPSPPPVARTTPAPSVPVAPSRARGAEPAPPPAAAAATEPVPRSAPPPPPVAPTPMFSNVDLNAEFDRNAAMEALRNASNAALACRGMGVVDGGVRVAVTFARTGQVADAHVDGAASGTPVGDCVASKFRSLRVPPFRGSSMTVRRTVTF